MPKQIWKIDQFHGGLNSNSDPRDIADNELSTVTGLMVDEVGKIRTIGATAMQNSLDVGFNGTIQPGYGLFYFAHDYLGAGVNLPPSEIPTNYIAFWDDDNSEVDILENLGGTFPVVGTSKISLGGSGGKPCFYYVDGALRISDGAQGANNTSKWYGFCNRKYFGADADEDFVSWKATDQLPAPPTAGYLRKHTGAANWDKSTNEKPTAADGFLRMSISANSTQTTTTWLSLLDWDDNSEGTGDLDGYWYTKWGARDVGGGYAYSEHLDSNMEGTGYVGADFFSPGNGSASAGGNGVSRDWDPGGVQILLHATEGSNVPDAPPGWDTDIAVGMNIMKVKSEIFCRYSVKTDEGIDFTGKSLFFDLFISAHAYSVIDYMYIYIGDDIGTYDSTTSSTAWKKWRIDKGQIDDAQVDNWQQFEIYTGDEPELQHGSPHMNAVKAFAIQVHVNADSDKLGYTTGDADPGDIVLYNVRYGDPIEGAGWNGYYNFYYSWLYDDEKQETSLFEFLDHGAGSATNYNFTGSALHFRSWVQQAAHPTYGFNHATTSANPRITGANVYYTIVDSSGNSIDPEFYHVCTIDFENGIKSVEGDDFSAWAGGAGGSIGEWYAPSESPLKLDIPSQAITYTINSGYDDSNKITNLYYKTAVVANRIAYIGNVKYTDANSKDHVLGDAILKSHVNKFDLFTSDRVIEASVRDGDSIVKLEEYADRLLQFGKTKMHLINISQEIEFLEDTFMHKGVSHPAATCKTDFGIAWVNKHGCYLYDGQNVVNLLEKNGMQMIKESEWKDFVESSAGTSLDPMIGYIPQKRQLLVISDVGDSMNEATEPQIYLYDMVTQSWVNAEHSATVVDYFYDRNVDLDKTNFVNDWDGNLVLARATGTLRKWSDTSRDVDSGKLHLRTKDIDFGQPAQRKKVYKVYISYKGDASSVDIQYSINGDNNTTFPFYRILTDGTGDSDKTNSDTTPLYDCDTDDWVTAELKPVSSINNVKSFQLVIAGSAESDFEINDMSIVYRLKGIK
jgi:hypothetical protein